MAFSVTYHQLTTHNIRNLYGGLPQEIRWRVPTYTTALYPAQGNGELHKRYPDRFTLRRLYEYNPEFNIHLHKAPAFRELNEAKVDLIVSRLSQRPTRTPRMCHGYGGDRKRSGRSDIAQEAWRSNSCTTRSRNIKADKDKISCRLQRPTTSARIREISRQWSANSLQQIQAACDRRPPSSRLGIAMDE